MEKFDTQGLIAFVSVVGMGVGGAIAAQSLGASELAGMILTFCAGLLVPMGRLVRRDA